jgi:uncharacterized membrane protein YkgB
MSSIDRRKADDGLQVRHEDTSPSPGPSAPDPPPIGLDKDRPDVAVAMRGTALDLGYVSRIGQRIAELAARWFEPAARIAVFIIFFWFGLLKLIGLSPATPLASALTSNTIGMQYFNISFKTLAVYECALAIMFLIPALTWLSVVLLAIHMGVVSSPLVIVANVAWTHPLVPTLEGQYIIKDVAILALALGIIAQRRLPGDRPKPAVRPGRRGAGRERQPHLEPQPGGDHSPRAADHSPLAPP